MMRRVPVILVLLLLATGLRTAQELRMPVVRFSHPVLDEINAMVNARKYKGAIDLSLKTAERMRSESNWEGYISFMLRAAEVETFEVWKGKGFPGVEIYPDYRRPLKYLESINQYAGKIIEDYPYLKANTMFTNAVVYGWLAMADTSELLHKHALELRKNLYGESSREVADSYLWLGVLYNGWLQRKDLAEVNYRKALELQKNFMPASRYALGSVYYGLANIARENFQFDEALILANQYLALYHDIPYEQAFGLQLIANVYWNQDNFEKALEFRKQAINLYKESGFKEDLFFEYSNLSSDLANLKRYDEAEQALKNGEKILNSLSHVRNPYYTKMLFENFGDLYRLMKKYDVAERYFNKALSIAVNQYGELNDEVADIYRMQGQLFMDQMQFENALKNFQKTLHSVIPAFSSTDYRVIPEVQHENPYFRNIIAATFNKGDAFLLWFISSGNTELLQSALNNYHHAYHQILIARQTIGDELSKTFLMSKFYKSIENSIVCARMLYRKTNNQKFIDDILYFVELTKYLNVLDALQRAERANHSDVPLELLFQLESTRSELNKLQRIQLESKHLVLSSDSVANLRNRVLDLIQTRRELMSKIKAHSGYGIVNPDSMLFSMTDIQKQLKNDEQILEFFWGTDSIYTISLTNKSADVTATINTIEMDNLLLNVHRILEGQLSHRPDEVENYSVWTSMIFHKLFEPVMSRKRVIVIPDGSLNLVPVEALVSKHQSGKSSFRDLAYLIHDHEISYAYSSSILFHKARSKGREIENVLAFSYSGNESNTGFVRQNQLAALPGTYKELEALSRLFKNVTRFAENDALKTNFINTAQHYDLIHLGIHGIGDREVPDNSRLIFRGDSLESGDLYAYDIYNLNIDARLVVLSACETGLGKRQSGEGIFSIARAFSYAGCPSVVMSMWRAHDTFTASIMEGFYEGLNDGHSLSASLRGSKLNFIKESDEFLAHPANWAAFVLNGQDQSFSKKTTSIAVWLMLVATSGVVVFFVLRWKRILF